MKTAALPPSPVTVHRTRRRFRITETQAIIIIGLLVMIMAALTTVLTLSADWYDDQTLLWLTDPERAEWRQEHKPLYVDIADTVMP